MGLAGAQAAGHGANAPATTYPSRKVAGERRFGTLRWDLSLEVRMRRRGPAVAECSRYSSGSRWRGPEGQKEIDSTCPGTSLNTPLHTCHPKLFLDLLSPPTRLSISASTFTSPLSNTCTNPRHHPERCANLFIIILLVCHLGTILASTPHTTSPLTLSHTCDFPAAAHLHHAGAVTMDHRPWP